MLMLQSLGGDWRDIWLSFYRVRFKYLPHLTDDYGLRNKGHNPSQFLLKYLFSIL